MSSIIARDELLPLVHQCWQPLKVLFDSDNLLVLERAFRVVLVFARCAGDFVAARTLKDVLPAMMRCTRKMQVRLLPIWRNFGVLDAFFSPPHPPQSVLSDSGRRHTAAHRQSRRLLEQLASTLSELPALLDLDEPEVDDILEELLACEDYFRHRQGGGKDQPVPESFRPSRPVDADALWLKTNYARLMQERRSDKR